jgi:NAD-dependent deacetylase
LSIEERLVAEFKAGKQALVLTGAGVSTGAGVPDFTGNPTYKGRSVSAILSVDSLSKPALLDEFLKSFITDRNSEPCVVHTLLADLETSGRIIGVATQNIDGLHQKAGQSTVVELHGSAYKRVCTGCGKGCDVSEPGCLVCGADSRTDVLLYGEELPKNKVEQVHNLLDTADFLLVLGTRLKTMLAQDLVLYTADRNKPVYVIAAPVDSVEELWGAEYFDLDLSAFASSLGSLLSKSQ